MKLSVILLLVGFLHASAGGFSQSITLRERNGSLENALLKIKKQTSFLFLYDKQLLQGAGKVTLNLQNVSLQEALEACFRNQPLSFKIFQNTVVIGPKSSEAVVASSDRQPNSPREYVSPPIPIFGIVKGPDGKPVAGATISIRNRNIAGVTNAEGVFSLNVTEGDILLISHIGFKSKELLLTSSLLEKSKLNGQTYIAIDLSKQTDDLDEAVVVAYNTTTKRMNTGAVTVIKGEQIATLPNRSFEKSLQGLVPGLLVNSGTGQPGAATNNFVLRGIATGGMPDAGQSFRNPLIVVDGVPVFQDPLKVGASGDASESNPMAQLNPSDIESITVLKDAAAIALYGSKASNGVLLVTTKKGKAGKTIFNFRHQTDISERMKDPPVLNQDEYLELLFEAHRNSFPGMTDAQILADLRSSPNVRTSVVFPIIVNAPGDTSFYPAPDWNAEFFRKSAVTLANQLSMSGGTERSNFYLNLEYTKQDGVIKATGFDRKSIRFNYENKVAPWLKVGLNTSLSYNIQNYQLGTSLILSASPLLPIRDLDAKFIDNYTWGLGTNGTTFVSNPLLASELNIKRNTSYRGLSKLYGEFKMLKYFTFTSNIGVDFIINENKEKIHPRFYVSSAVGNGSIKDQTVRNANILSTNILRFDRLFAKDHSINVLLGQEAQILTNKYNFIEYRGFGSNPTATEPYSGTLYNAIGNTDKQTLLSYFGQANYGFRDKYFLSGSVRTDGSSRFGDNKRFGTYWSMGGGWIATAEPFMKKTGNWLSYLKFRGSIGAAGNSSAIAGSLRYDQLLILAYLNNTAVLPNNTYSPGNPDIQWEETFTWDAGVEARFWKERIALTADRYNRKTSELIAYNVQIPSATGFSNLTDNIGDVKNTGVEISLSIDIIRNGNFRWNLNANWSKNESKLIKSNLPQISIANNLVNKVGEAYNSFYLRRWAGVNPDNGRPQWIDSTTEKPTETYNTSKPEIVGKSQPDGFGAITSSFSYKGFELSGMLYYQYGFQIYLNNTLQNDGLNPYINQTRDALNRWQKPGDVALNPRRLMNGKVGTVSDLGTSASTRYLYDGDFIRLSNVILAYNLPKKILNRMRLSSLKIFAQGHNLATWTKYSGQDPENVNSQHRVGAYLYPQQRSYSIGLNLNF